MKKDLFGYDTQGKLYDTFRPRYPQSQLSSTLSHLPSKLRNRYLDIATGTGQLLFHFCSHFKHSEGIDISQKMINVCREKISENKIKGVEVRVGDFMQMDNKDKYQLITIGQALHWIPIREFLVKCGKMLEDGGILAVYGYILNDVKTQSNNVQQNSILSKLYHQFYDKKVKPNFDFDRDQLHTHYSDAKRYPFNQIFPRVQRQLLQVEVPMNKQQFICYLKTYSGYNTYLERFPNEPNPILDLENKMSQMEKQIMKSKQNANEGQFKAIFDYFCIRCWNQQQKHGQKQ